MDRTGLSLLAKVFKEHLDDGMIERFGHLFMLRYVPFEFAVTVPADRKNMVVVPSTPESPW